MRFSLFNAISLYTDWLAPTLSVGPPTVFCAMKSHSQPFRDRDPDPIQILTITRPWDWLWESMPQLPSSPSSVPSYRGT